MGILERLLGQKERIQAYKQVFKSQQGEIILHDLMKSFSILKPVNVENAQKAAYQEGQRSVVLAIMALMEYDEAALAREIEKVKQKEQLRRNHER